MAESVSIPTLNHLFFHVLDRGDKIRLLHWRDAGGRPVEYSTSAFGCAVYAVYRYLGACGLAPGDRVAIFSENRPEWHVVDFAIQLARMVVVPIYPTLSPEQTHFLLEHSGCRAAFVGGPERLELLRAKLAELPELSWVIGMDDSIDTPVSVTRLVVQAAGAGFSSEQRSACLDVAQNSLATIVYTSGTTARPKGVMLSHANLTFDLDRCITRLAFRTTERALSVLPLPHVFERILCYGYLRMGVSIAYGSPHDLKHLLHLYRPQVMGCVPRVLEKIHESVEAQLASRPPLVRRLARFLIQAAIEDAQASAGPGAAGSRHSLAARAARWVVVPRLRRKLGGIENFICGGAWLDPDIELFFRALRFMVLQGYGLTETSPVITLNAPGRERLGSVGRPLDGVEIDLSNAGEILTGGAHVMLGYYKDPEATAEVLQNRWLATGDLGRVDGDGYLFVTGRAKEMVVLSNGKKVYCPTLEQAIERSRYVRKVFVVGQGRKFVAALLVPHMENLKRLALEREMQFSSPLDLLTRPDIYDLMHHEVDVQQSHFSRFEQVKKFCFMTDEEIADPELVTPTQKVRRHRLEVRFSRRIESMYADEIAASVAATQIPAGYTIEKTNG
jgi:long-chain acyl-CoA synthetase